MFKKGQVVVKVIVGGGYKTASFQRVAAVRKGVVTLIDNESLSWDAKTGREIDPAISGFYSEIIPLDGGEEDRLRNYYG